MSLKEPKKPQFLATDDFDHHKLGIENWLKAWVEKNSVTMNYHGWLTFRGKHLKLTDFLDRLFIDAKAYSGKFSDRLISAGFNLFASSEKQKIFNSAVEKFAKVHFPHPKPLISQFVKAITGEERAVDIAVIRHFVWQVKRRMLGLRVEHHMMPVLVGEQGAGKTEAIKAFLKPISDLYIGKRLDEITDERHWEIFRMYPIVVVDEMAQAEKTCLQTLKYVIAEDERLTYRPMRTNHQETLQPITTFIGSSNLPLEDVIKDKSGNRRFGQINTLDRMDWATINSVDYQALWMSVNAYEECPIADYLDEIKKHQRQNRYKVSIDYFIEDYDIAANTRHKISTDVLWEEYRKWCDESGYGRNAYTKHYFGREMSRLKFKCARLGRNGKGFYVSSSKISGEIETGEKGLAPEAIPLSPFAEDLVARLGEPEHDSMAKWVHQPTGKE